MAAFTLTANRNIDYFTGKTGGDTYDTAGFSLIIDQDSRQGLNQTTTTSLGTITINATTGGQVLIDGTQIWIIPFTGGSGTVPAYNTTISRGTGSGLLIGVHSAITLSTAPTAPGSAMPASGWIRVKQKSGTYTAGSLTGITATASDQGRVGWLEIVGDDGATIIANRLGTFNVTGEWFELGTTTGSGDSFYLPGSGTVLNCGGVYVETSAGSGAYEFWPNKGTSSGPGTEEARGKVCSIAGNGTVSFTSYVPGAGRKVRVPNVFLYGCTTAARASNAFNTTLATRYDFTTTGGGVISLNKCSMNWYLSATQAYSVSATDTVFADAVSISELASPITWTRCGVGPTGAALVNSPALTFTLSSAGGVFDSCKFYRQQQSASGYHISTLTDLSGVTFTGCTFGANIIRNHATNSSIFATRVANCTFTGTTIVQGNIGLASCSNLTFTNTAYIDAATGSTLTTFTQSLFAISAGSLNIMMDGVTLPVANTAPYIALMTVAAGGCTGLTLRNIGTFASPLAIHGNSRIYTLATGASASNIKIQRVYTTGGLGIMTGDNSSSGVLEESVHAGYATNVDSAVNNVVRKGLGATASTTAQTAVYGSLLIDYFPSTTTGKIVFLWNDPTALTPDQVTITGNARYNSAGVLRVINIGTTVTVTTPYYIKGHTGFANIAMTGGNATYFTYAYQIDKNDGSGFSAWSAELTPTTLGTALSNITGIDASLGFKIKVRATAITSTIINMNPWVISTTSTTTSQAYQYPLDPPRVLTLSGLQPNSDVVILKAGTTTEWANVDQNPTSSFQYSYQYAVDQYADIGIFKAGYVPFYIRNYLLTDGNATIPVAQVVDRNYS